MNTSTLPRTTSTWDAQTVASLTVESLVARKQELGCSISVVLPARNEAATVGSVVRAIDSSPAQRGGLIDELVVIDSDSTDATYAAATEAGATVLRAAEIRPDLGWRAGKGEALWKSQLVTGGDILVFLDADLTEWGSHFIPGLVAPLLADPEAVLVKGFYDRPLQTSGSSESAEGGRVTELVARPLIATLLPELGDIVQPLGGEWAIRRTVFETLSVPSGYGVEIAVLADVVQRFGIDAVAQVDLGRRAHQHQSLADLGPMATQILSAALSRVGHTKATVPVLRQFQRLDGVVHPRDRAVDTYERGPARELAELAAHPFG